MVPISARTWQNRAILNVFMETSKKWALVKYIQLKYNQLFSTYPLIFIPFPINAAMLYYRFLPPSHSSEILSSYFSAGFIVNLIISESFHAKHPQIIDPYRVPALNTALSKI